MKKALLFICTLLTITGIKLSAQAAEPDAGDEIAVTESISTKETDDTPSQINLSLDTDESFSLSVYAEIQNTDTGKIYRLNLYHDNEYLDKCFVEEGTYKVLEIASYEDSTGTYAFTYPEDFTLGNGDTIDLTTSISDSSHINQDIQPDIIDGSTSYETDFNVFHEGTGAGQVAIIGDQNDKYELVINIETSGVPGGFSVKYSLDDGITWSETKNVPLHGSLDLFVQSDNGSSLPTGLTAIFTAENATDSSPFVEGDYYYSHINDPKTSVISEHIGDSSVEMEIAPLDKEVQLYDILSDKDLSFYVKVLKSGVAGESVIEISLDGGKTFMEERLTPKTALKFESLGLRVSFPHSDTYQFKEGDIYTVYPYRESYLKAYILAIVLSIATSLAIVCAYIYLRSKLPGDDVWHIHDINSELCLSPVLIKDEYDET